MKNKYGSDIEVILFYKDIRTFGKGYEELYNKTRALGVQTVKGHPSEILKDVNGQIAEMKYLVTDPQVIEANARLIASAPELLEACKILKLQIECGGTQKYQGTAWFHELEQAIAKAEGK